MSVVLSEVDEDDDGGGVGGAKGVDGGGGGAIKDHGRWYNYAVCGDFG